MKAILAIIRRNTLQPIVIGILLLASALLVLGERRDAWFVSCVIIVNTAFAIIQELRARSALKKLELMSQPKARRLNEDGTVTDVSFRELVVGDRLDIRMGDEVPADVRIVSNRGLEVNESMLTGESAAVIKDTSDIVFATSAVTAGSAIVVTEAVGEQTRAGTMTQSLKRYVPRLTPLQRSIARLITAMTYGALAVAALISIVYVASGQDAVQIVKTITSAAVTLVPEGLLLASTVLLAFGSLRLAQARVLPQKLSAIEGMALLDVLCVDKTGTLTSDTIRFGEYIELPGAPAQLPAITGSVAFETSSGNATGDAMISGLPVLSSYDVVDRLAFSSSRKYSGARIVSQGKEYSVLIGAPELLKQIAPRSADVEVMIDTAVHRGDRVLAVVQLSNEETPSLHDIPAGAGKTVGLIILTNELRHGVTEAIQYLQENGVVLKVISGDHKETVRSVARQAGVAHVDRVLTGDQLSQIPEAEWDATIRNTTIFARVLPEQKERIIQTYAASGAYTGMVGDGINDALALKRADLGVAMYAGASVTRRVADIVLLDNSFTSLPFGMKLGGRIMLTIEMIAALFFHKILYGGIVLLATMLLGIVYPFEPRHVTFMNIFLVTLPTVLWTVFTPLPGYHVSPKRFWSDTLVPMLPIAAISGLTVALSYVHLSRLHADDPGGVATTTVLIATFFGVYLVFLVGHIFRVRLTKRAAIARLLYIAAVVFVVSISFGFGGVRDFFSFTLPAWQDMWPLVVMIIGAIIVQWLVADRFSRRKQSV